MATKRGRKRVIFNVFQLHFVKSQVTPFKLCFTKGRGEILDGGVMVSETFSRHPEIVRSSCGDNFE